ncbi:MAG: sigma-54-dependent transcriptional regulator [Acidobacteriota bacterium]
MARILVADDDPGFRSLLADILESAGHDPVEVRDGAEALSALERGGFDLVLSDQRMPRVDGLELLRRMRAGGMSTPLVVLTAYGTIPDAVEAVRMGAADYMTKPLPSPAALLAVVNRLLAPAETDDTLVAGSSGMREVLDLIDRVAPRDVAVLVTGESGTGKELIARRLHARSGRSSGPFVAVNCAALPESLAESELFGHEKGAFTGADRQRRGRFEEADGGTLLLDEVGELPATLQAKLLRVLEERTVRRVGGTEEVAVDVRLVAATNRELAAAVEAGTFRRDLFYRLAVVEAHLPPLRERHGDVAALAEHLLERLAARHGVPRSPLGPEALAALERHDWPGNVRELRNVLERAVVVRAGAPIRTDDLALHRSGAFVPPPAPAEEAPLDRDAREREAVVEALRRADGNREQAARMLGISVRTLYYRLRKFGLS